MKVNHLITSHAEGNFRFTYLEKFDIYSWSEPNASKEAINYSTDINYNSIIYFANFLSGELAKYATQASLDYRIKHTAPKLKREI